MATVNIRGAKVYLAAATAGTGTSGITQIADIVGIEQLPETGSNRRNVTELADTTESYLGGRLKTVGGQVVYVAHADSTGLPTDRSGLSGLLRIDIPVDGTNTSATTYVQVSGNVHFTGHQIEPGDKETDVTVRVTAEPLGVFAFATASY